MNSNYGESVKFYEKISHLHNQLQNYEEEQYTLQEEFERLCKDSNNSTIAITDTLSNMNKDSVGGGIVHSGPRGILKIDGLSIEEKRTRRNQVILEKIKELEANASVFAARSEKLRIMRAEYEILVRKYMQGRQSTNSSSIRNINAATTLSLLNGKLGVGHKSVVSIGVNTSISGAIKPTGGNKFESMSGNVFEGNNGNYPELNKNSFRSIYIQSTSQIDNVQNDESHQQEQVDRIEDYDRTRYLMNKLYSKSNENLSKTIESNGNSLKRIEVKQPMRVGRINFDENLLENEDSLTGKLHHNPYFDMSTTSESDLTSAGVGAGGGTQNLIKKNNMLPITIPLDDTTQSDTMSLSLQIPSKLATLNHKNNTTSIKAELFNLSSTTDQSQSESMAPVPLHSQKDEINKRQKEMTGLKSSQSNRRIDFLTQSLHQNQAWNDNNTTFTVPGGNEHDQDQRVDNDKERENENDMGIVSDSMNTSCADSIMDSVQNRTLNEALPRLPQDNNFELPTTTTNVTTTTTLNPVSTRLSVNQRHTEKYEEENSVKLKTVAEISFKERSKQPVAPSQTHHHHHHHDEEQEQEKSNDGSSQIITKKNSIVNRNPTTVTVMHQTRDEFGLGTQLYASTANFEEMTNKFFDNKPNDEDKDELDGLDWVLKNKMLSPEVKRDGSVQEMGGKQQELTGKIEEEVENKKLVPSVQSSSRPKTAAASSSSAASRRVRIKLDYEDSDSESLEAPAQQAETGGGDNKIGSLKAEESQGPKKGNQVDATDDDDFDDFFDI